MNIATPLAPPPGSAVVGDLYADLQSRTLWLGVDPAVDPDGAVLISDLLGLMEQITTGDDAVTAYVDSQISTRAPTSHTHTSSQITDFNAAVTAIASSIPALQFTHGMVMMYSGSLADVGVGDLAGWTLCDGSNGSPDLRERFILAAGSRAVGSKNAANNFTTSDGGGHDHQIAATALTVAQLPSHNHGGNTGNDSVNHQHYVSGTTDVQGNHNHGNYTDGYPIPSSGSWSLRAAGSSTSGGTSYAGNHAHNLNVWSGGVNQWHQHPIPLEGSGQGHTHVTVGGGGIHNHNITGSQLREAVPFYALAFIMKL